MNIHLHIANVHVHVRDDKHMEMITDILKTHTNQLKKIIMTNEELLAKVNEANANVTASNEKADKIILEVQALKDLVNTTPNVPQNIVDAVETLSANTQTLGSKLQALDDINEDAPPPPPEG